MPRSHISGRKICDVFLKNRVMAKFPHLKNIAITHLFYLEYSSQMVIKSRSNERKLRLYSTRHTFHLPLHISFYMPYFYDGSLFLGKIKSVALQKSMIGFEENSIIFLSFLRLNGSIFSAFDIVVFKFFHEKSSIISQLAAAFCGLSRFSTENSGVLCFPSQFFTPFGA